MLDTMNAYGTLNYGESDIPKDVFEQKYEVANQASFAEEGASSAPPEIDLVTWFQKAGYMPYVSGDVTFQDILLQWKTSDWDQLINHISDTQILKDASPQEQARFKDYLYSLREQAANVAPRISTPKSKAAPTPVIAPKRDIQSTSLVQSKGILSKVIPMPIVQLGLAGAGYYVGKYFNSPYIGAAIGASVIPIYKSRAPQVVHHSRKAMGAFFGTASDSIDGSDMSDDAIVSAIKDQQMATAGRGPNQVPSKDSFADEAEKKKSGLSKVTSVLPIGLGTIAMALSYSRNQSILKSIGAGIIAPIYLTYVGIEYAKKKMK